MKTLIDENKMNKEQLDKIEYGLLMVVSFLTFMFLLYWLTGKNCFTHNTYQTYAFQAEAWTHGKLDLDENYSWLEIAEYNGKFYCSFPPFPSYVLFPFAIICGHETPDAFILLMFDILALLALYNIALHFKIKPAFAMLCAFSITICSNFIFDIFDPAVWFFAQAICFSLSCMSILCALKNKGGMSLLMWGAAVGCRPMIVVFLPVLLFILYSNEKRTNPELKLIEMIKNRINWAIPTFILALSYMLLNYLRFGSITEFGHNYLPEFVNVHKQFSFEYIGQNFKMLMHVPGIDENGKMIIDHFGNMNFLLINTQVVFFLIMLIYVGIKKEWKLFAYNVVILALMCVYLLFVMCHATMGGWHFGNRYSNEVLPFTFLGMVMMLNKHPKAIKWQLPFTIWGLCINIVGTIIVYNNL